jgi:hypothetical protein
MSLVKGFPLLSRALAIFKEAGEKSNSYITEDHLRKMVCHQ